MFLQRPLKYYSNSLVPYIDTETMIVHYDKHYKKYTDNLNAELDKLRESGQNIPNNIVDILKNYSNITAIRDNGGGYYNHLLYFDNISPFGNIFETSSDELQSMIFDSFGSFDGFKDKFKKAGLSVFGSGWVWLILHNGKLKIATTKNQDNPIMSLDCDVLLGMDVWEHAYYLKHKSDRAGYIEDFFDIIDWKVVSQRL
jgi:Fe-Mn family superoxide dismutase